MAGVGAAVELETDEPEATEAAEGLSPVGSLEGEVEQPSSPAAAVTVAAADESGTAAQPEPAAAAAVAEPVSASVGGSQDAVPGRVDALLEGLDLSDSE